MTGWVIESANTDIANTQYWTGFSQLHMSYWHEDALRFLRRIDAERILSGLPEEVVGRLQVVEHLWADVPLPSAGDTDLTPDARYMS